MGRAALHGGKERGGRRRSQKPNQTLAEERVLCIWAVGPLCCRPDPIQQHRLLPARGAQRGISSGNAPKAKNAAGRGTWQRTESLCRGGAVRDFRPADTVTCQPVLHPPSRAARQGSAEANRSEPKPLREARASRCNYMAGRPTAANNGKAVRPLGGFRRHASIQIHSNAGPPSGQ